MDPAAPEPLWSPSAAQAAQTAMHRFASAVPADHDLHEWSVDHADEFWSAVWDFCGVRGTRGAVLADVPDHVPPAERLRATRFLPDATLNVAENLLAEKVDPSSAAVIAVAEDGSRRELSWAELRLAVGRTQRALIADGVASGDRVALWLPAGVEAVLVTIAASALGAVVTSVSPDFGVAGVLDRFAQVDPVLLVASTHYSYGGKRYDIADRVAEVSGALPTVRRVVTLDGWEAWLAPHAAAEPEITALPFDHPWYVLYSSGTTGRPKSIVHRAGGLLLKHLSEHQLHCDIRPGDRVLYFTTLGWMMWNWLISALASGATIVLYDGNPMFPDPMRLWRLAADERITLFGTSAKYLDACDKQGLRPCAEVDLSALRTITSTGSPLVAERFGYVYSEVKEDVHLASISGGTDLCGCLVLGDPTRPVYAGHIQGPALGLDIDVTDDRGEPVPLGVRGELVCRNAFPSMPLRFWGDDDGSAYRRAYFDRIPGIWHHGDFAMETPEGGFVVLGRSDTTLNPGGVRIGTAEIYRQVESFPEVGESLVFGQDWDGDMRIVLALRLVAAAALDEELEQRIRATIRTNCTPRHVPAVILAVDDLPRTRSGKLVELAAAEATSGRPVRNTEAIANVEALWALRDHPLLCRGEEAP